MKKELWGYPALIRRFFDDVRPALLEERDNGKAHEENMGQEAPASGRISLHSTSGGKDQEKSNTAPSRRAPSDCPDVIRDSPDATYIEIRQGKPSSTGEPRLRQETQ